MAVFKQKILCWNLTSAVFVGLVYVLITVFFAIILRLVDLAAIISDDFEISQGFHTQWRSHQQEAFLASDIIILAGHFATWIFSLIMILSVTKEHFVMYMDRIKQFRNYFAFYTFVEFCFSVLEFSFYGMNTFRLAFVVFIWLYWMFRLAVNVVFILVISSRDEEMKGDMAYELRFSEKHYSHSYA
ncbi:hypothetical protein SNE40_020991 [Patella caerulea]|uniref:Uncharacterized protein n=1 Tax=Patella caerulea TaxID=87958 RepID=A0AAN8G644_PATCE